MLLSVILIYATITIAHSSEDIKLPSESWTGTYTQGGPWQDIARTRDTYSIVTWKFEITTHNYTFNSYIPQLFLRRDNAGIYINTKEQCFEGEQYVNTNIDPRLQSLSIQENKNCILRGSDLTCKGTLHVAIERQIKWTARVAYRCIDSARPNVSISYNITLVPYARIKCHKTSNILSEFEVPLPLTSLYETVGHLYESYSKWNYYGFSKKEYKEAFTLLIVATHAFSNCYQYLNEFVFRMLFPECTQGQIVYPCEEMCTELRAGCIKTGEELVTNYVPSCSKFFSRMSRDPCVYKHIICPNTSMELVNGHISSAKTTSVNSIRNITCNNGYDLVGNKSLICGYSGEWKIEQFPECIKSNATFEKSIDNISSEILIPLSAVGGFLITLLAVVLFIYVKYRFEVIVLMFKHCRFCLFCSRFRQQSDDKLYDAFVANEDADIEFVKRYIHEPLDEYDFKLFVDYRDGLPNQPITRYAAEGIAHSHRAILLLSQRFIDDGECMYMADQAFYQTLFDNKFRIIVVLMQDLKSLKNIPRFLKAFMATNSYIVHKDDGQFITKLRLCLPQVRRVSPCNDDIIDERQTMF